MACISDLLHQPSIELVPLWCPNPSASIRWVAVTEHLDPTPFLEGGELVLTSSCGNPSSPGAWAEYVSRLQTRQVSALAFGIGPWQRKVPRALLAAARQAELNLIEVPEQTNFVRISRLVADLLQEEAEAEERLLGRAQQDLIGAACSSTPIKSILTKLGDIVRADCALTTGERIIASPPTASFQADELLAAVKRCGSVASSEITPLQTLIVLPAGSLHASSTFLVVKAAHALPQWTRKAISTAGLLLQTAQASQEKLAATRLALSRRSLELFLAGDPHTAREIYALAYPHSKPLDSKLTVVAVKGSRLQLERVHKRVENSFAAPTRLTEDRLHILISPSALPLLLSHLQDHDIMTAVGSPKRQQDVSRSLATAEIALKKATAKRPQVSWEEVSGNSIMALVDEADAVCWAQDFLDPLRSQPQLRTILSAFIGANGNIAQVSQETSLHRNTVRMKLEQAQRLLHINLDDPAARVQVWFSLRALE